MPSAIAVFDGKIKGDVTLNLTGLKKNSHHGFHVHECGDISKGCAHFNPFNKKHGGPKSSERHLVDQYFLWYL